MTEKRELRNFINGEFVSSSKGEVTDIVNPATGETYATAPLSGPEDVIWRSGQRREPSTPPGGTPRRVSG